MRSYRPLSHKAMVATACERVMDLQTIITLLNSTVDTSNVDQALVIDFRKKYIINNINCILILLMLEPLEWRPSIFWFCFKQFTEWAGCGLSWLLTPYGLSHRFAGMSCSLFKENSSLFQLSYTDWAQKKWVPIFRYLWGSTDNCLLLQQEGVRGQLHQCRQDDRNQQLSVKREAISKKNYRFMVLWRSITHCTGVATLT